MHLPLLRPGYLLLSALLSFACLPAIGQAASSPIADPLYRSVKEFGAIGDGHADDTAALEQALQWMQAHGGCLYVPAGEFTLSRQLTWDTVQTLCLRGIGRQSAIVYLGTQSVDAAIRVENHAHSVFATVDLRDIGIAANAQARYAFHAVRIGGSSPMDNVYFMGGSESSFEGDFWNGQADLRNLFINPPYFHPRGSSGCVNGLTFSRGPVGPTDSNPFPSNQFTLTMPSVMGCSGIGLNLAHVTAITVNNAQLSNNHQQFYIGCEATGCNAVGSVLNNVLIEDRKDSVPSEVRGNRNQFNGLLATVQLDLYGSHNTFDSSQGLFHVQPGAIGNRFRNSYIQSESIDKGTDTEFVDSLDNFGHAYRKSSR